MSFRKLYRFSLRDRELHLHIKEQVQDLFFLICISLGFSVSFGLGTQQAEHMHSVPVSSENLTLLPTLQTLEILEGGLDTPAEIGMQKLQSHATDDFSCENTDSVSILALQTVGLGIGIVCTTILVVSLKEEIEQ